MMETSLHNRPVFFNCYPNFSLNLSNRNVMDALTLNVKTDGYYMKEGSEPLAIIYSIYYKLMKTTLDPQSITPIQTEPAYYPTEATQPTPNVHQALYEPQPQPQSQPDSSTQTDIVGFTDYDKRINKDILLLIYEWNIDGMSECEIINLLHEMTLLTNVYKNHGKHDHQIAHLIVTGFTGQLKGWWDHYLNNDDRNEILTAVKRETDGSVIMTDRLPSQDAVSTLIFTIAKHFVVHPNQYKERASDVLINLRCPQLSEFRWYKDVFISKVLSRNGCQQSYWKEKFIALLRYFFVEKVRLDIENNDRTIDYPNKLISIKELIDSDETDNESHQIDNCDTISSSSSIEVSSHDEKVKLRDCNNPDNCYCKRKIKISVLTKQEDIIRDLIDKLPDLQSKKDYLSKLEESLTQTDRFEIDLKNHKSTYNFAEITDRFKPNKPITVIGLQTDINNLKNELKELRSENFILKGMVEQIVAQTSLSLINIIILVKVLVGALGPVIYQGWPNEVFWARNPKPKTSKRS
ncbi:hypothetical protein ACB092_05G252200 [Castanea dentata]